MENVSSECNMHRKVLNVDDVLSATDSIGILDNS